MTEILTAPTPGRRRPGSGGMKKHSVRTDMTPMVDLGFLLITFFVFTAELTKPSVVKLNMPKEGKDMLVPQSTALTILLDRDDRVYYYYGDWEGASASNEIFITNLSVTNGIGKVIREKQQQLITKKNTKTGKDDLMLLIKPGKEASYKSVIDALDETLINEVRRYAILRADKAEVDWIQKHQPKITSF